MIDDLRARLDTASGREWLRRAVWAVVALSLLAFIVRGAIRPEDPYLEVPTVSATGAQRLPLEGFEEIAFRVTAGDGTVRDWCALLAATAAARQQGLMNQTDLRGYDAMVFRFDAPSTGGFWMKDTLIPLSIAWFGADGRFVSSADMPPCPKDAAECPSYKPAGPYTHAVEVGQGGLGALGIGAGATLSFPGGDCA